MADSTAWAPGLQDVYITDSLADQQQPSLATRLFTPRPSPSSSAFVSIAALLTVRRNTVQAGGLKFNRRKKLPEVAYSTLASTGGYR